MFFDGKASRDQGKKGNDRRNRGASGPTKYQERHCKHGRGKGEAKRFVFWCDVLVAMTKGCGFANFVEPRKGPEEGADSQGDKCKRGLTRSKVVG